ncbi:unnamed protein product [Cylindrotheca closterium]|uniref:glutamate dehydrogenase (NADP(+)) n=1 Tax=Cylindrotheca closterium TaxID=2856 RepID=A0AAD2GAM1_9STRA|nr:unnamed protein product [Cylindrotheca closterium]
MARRQQQPAKKKKRGGRLSSLFLPRKSITILLMLSLVWSCKASSSTSSSSSSQSTFRPSKPSADLEFLEPLYQKYPHQPIFLQCVEEVALSLLPLFSDDNEEGQFYKRAFLAMTEPERVISFRVPWEDDDGNLRYNRGWRVEFSSVLGPYKGGLRFHPTVDEGVLKFLGFEQIFKNALTGLPLGGGKGGSDFDPKGKSPQEMKRFCQSFMTELHRYLHPSTDVPAGDIGVGGSEIGYMYGTYKRLTNRHGEGVLTGKSLAFGGSPLRPEATGYGLVYIAKLAMEDQRKKDCKDDKDAEDNNVLKGVKCKVSGSGNVAQYAAQKLLELGAKVMTMSDSNGALIFDNDNDNTGMTQEDLQQVMECKNVHRGRLSQLEGKVSGRYIPDATVWNLPPQQNVACEIALPCATQNEIDESAAQRLVEEGIYLVAEGANLPTTTHGQEIFRRKQEEDGLVYIPAKAANAGGVGVSGLEMSQNAQKLTWTTEEVDDKLQSMMKEIYHQCQTGGDTTTTTTSSSSSSSDEKEEAASMSLEEGANRAGFRKVAHAMRELGWVQ